MTTEPENVSDGHMRIYALCEDGKGNIDPTKWIAFRDVITLREFLAMEEAHIVISDERSNLERHMMDNPGGSRSRGSGVRQERVPSMRPGGAK